MKSTEPGRRKPKEGEPTERRKAKRKPTMKRLDQQADEQILKGLATEKQTKKKQ